jgi:metallophosphoesterase (TIGR03767 family)
MSRIRSAVNSVDRRHFLAAAGAVGASAGIGLALGVGGGSGEASAASTPAAARSTTVPSPRKPASTAPGAPAVPARTTIDSVSTPSDPEATFQRLQDGPGWHRVVREDIAAGRSGRDAKRRALTAFVQLTDLHLADVQHPVRTEYLREAGLSAWRPQEALSVQGAVALIERINAVRTAPVTRAPITFAVTTGDNSDNNSLNELEWFLGVMSGGRISPNSGDPKRYEGVQSSGDKLYWHPESALRDTDKHYGFPMIDGYLEAAIAQVNSPGLRIPWYSTVGNHDALTSGAMADRSGYLAEFAVGDRKLFSLPEAEANPLRKVLQAGSHPSGDELVALLKRHERDMRPVTADAGRAPFTPHDYLAAHLDPAHTGPGPYGHGYGADNLAGGTQYYTFSMGPEVVGVSIDTTDRGGHFLGSIGTEQLDWLDRTLTDHQGSHAVVFSHHNSWTMTNTHPDPAKPKETRHTGDELVAVLKKHRNVRAWVNGHSHRNKILPHGSFWEVSTASHVDRPQLARIIELADNGDGTLSLFTTLIESGAPSRTDFHDLSQTGLAAMYREFSHNAPGASTTAYGTEQDRNTELVLRA